MHAIVCTSCGLLPNCIVSPTINDSHYTARGRKQEMTDLMMQNPLMEMLQAIVILLTIVTSLVFMLLLSCGKQSQLLKSIDESLKCLPAV